MHIWKREQTLNTFSGQVAYNVAICPLTCTTQWSKTIIEHIKNLADTNFDGFNFCNLPHPRKLSAREKKRLYGITIITIQQACCIYLQMQLSRGDGSARACCKWRATLYPFSLVTVSSLRPEQTTTLNLRGHYKWTGCCCWSARR